MTDITVIIPMYNSATTIGNAVESVIMQKNVSVEILCVDDGSTDGTISTLKERFGNNDSVSILRQEHKGPGAARNMGIENATGRYIAFMDADDHLMDDTALYKMIDRCERLDVPVCGALMNLEENGIIRRSNAYSTIRELTKKGVLRYKDYQFDYDFTSYVYRRELFDDSDVRFSESFFYEDPPFLVRALYKAESFTVLDLDYYCYFLPNRIRELSGEQCEALIDGLERNLLFAKKHDLEILLRNTLDRLVYEYADWVFKYVGDYPKVKDGVEIIRTLVDDSDIIADFDRVSKRTYKRDYEEYLTKRICENEQFYVFGNGKVANSFLRYLDGYEEIKGRYTKCVVSKKDPEDNTVIDVETYAGLVEKGLLIIAVSGIYIGEVVRMIKGLKIENYEILDMVFLSEIQRKMSEV